MGTRTVLSSLIFFVLIVTGCKEQKKENTGEYAAGTAEGFKLAKQHCSSCHKFVPANVLNRLTWKDHVLPDMATQLGIRVLWGKEYVDEESPKAPITFRNWMKIVDYYTKTAPEKIQLPATVPPATDTSLFQVRSTSVKFQDPAMTVLTKMDTVTGYIYTGDGMTDRIYKWNDQLQIIDSAKLNSPASDVFFINEGGNRKAVFTTMGTMQARDILNGNVVRFDLNKKLTGATDTIALALPRPIQSLPADFNHDGHTDWLVCGFGRRQGGLYWMKKLPEGNYSKEVIIEIPGATQAVVKDFNNDGWDDIIILFAHSEESVRLLTNNKKGGFDQRILLSFPPVYGSTSFQLVDFNKDGLDDILYSCGDNADVSRIMKPFHGVYIFLNKGNGNYVQSYFHYINGCTKAIAADFDKDGDLDIATIAFYADFKNNPAEKFQFLRQDTPLKFQSFSPPIEKNGRWLTMDVNDYDRDGDLDIILGNFSKGLFIEDLNPDWDLYSPITILENRSLHK
jgi:hypothetical protein